MITDSGLNNIPHEILPEDFPSHDALYKVVIVGDTGVGKSCLMLRGTKNEFKEDHEVTLAVDFGSISLRVAHKVIKLQIWDTAGQETFQSVAKVFYKGAQCIFLVYDITREETFNKLKSWLAEIRDAAAEDTLLVLVGNMLDLDEQRIVSKEQALEFKGQENLEAFVETSAKTGANVRDLFVRVAKLLYLKDPVEDQKEVPELIRIEYRSDVNSTKKGCQC